MRCALSRGFSGTLCSVFRVWYIWGVSGAESNRLAPVAGFRFSAGLLRISGQHRSAQSSMSEEETDPHSSRYNLGNVTTRVQSSFVFSGPMFVILMVMMVTLVVVIVLGNALVILAFKVDKSLRRQCNYYFLNLAISDFLVGKSILVFFSRFSLFIFFYRHWV